MRTKFRDSDCEVTATESRRFWEIFQKESRSRAMHRKRYGESRTRARRAIYSDFPSVQLDDSERAGQPNSGALGFGGEEGLENLGLNVDRNTSSGVADRYSYNLLLFLSD